ncbi:hypothetical protein DYB30_002915 [Aphanomyces astaci]|uniref:MRG domain-containing protein n=1 Tax=Aphanomyces astaci TaxID=112090 RepID=A0A397DKH8_APHAT|nr:hypothetical protein DYB30_002915 [Aphanomyces astaci]RHY63904.1 hypothetical protein DYB38_006988 [Aphanomyces astaci]RHZ18280.1 hypothetical protein DYB31_003792 [Aphanomyces astaci]
MKASKPSTKLAAADVPLFAVNDIILVKHGIEIFDAKILRLDENSMGETEGDDGYHYVVGYGPRNSGMNPYSCMSSCVVGVMKKKSKVVDPFDDSVVIKDHARDLEEVVQEVQVSIPIPMTLKKVLIDDWKKITQEQQWIDMPRVPSVRSITRPMLEGLEAYFNRALPLILLYRHERAQYDQIAASFTVTDDSSAADRAAAAPAAIYGAEHLLRLFGTAIDGLVW